MAETILHEVAGRPPHGPLLKYVGTSEYSRRVRRYERPTSMHSIRSRTYCVPYPPLHARVRTRRGHRLLLQGDMCGLRRSSDGVLITGALGPADDHMKYSWAPTAADVRLCGAVPFRYRR